MVIIVQTQGAYNNLYMYLHHWLLIFYTEGILRLNLAAKNLYHCKCSANKFENLCRPGSLKFINKKAINIRKKITIIITIIKLS